MGIIRKIIKIKVIVKVGIILKGNSTITQLGLIIGIKKKGSKIFKKKDQIFIGYAYKIVYVGAISILFIFTIMLIVNKLTFIRPMQGIQQESSKNGIIIGKIVKKKCVIISKIRIKECYMKLNIDWTEILIYKSDLRNIGIAIYEYHWFLILLLGFLLFGVLIGILQMSLIR